MLTVLTVFLLTSAPPVPTQAPAPRPVRGWRVEHTFTHKAPVRALAATRGAFVTGDVDGVLVLWDAKTGKRRETLLDGTNEATKQLRFLRPSPDGKQLDLIAGGRPGQIVWEANGPEVRGPYFGMDCTGFGGDLWLARRPPGPESDPNMVHLLQMGFQSNGYSTGTVRYHRHPAPVQLAAATPRLTVTIDGRGTVRGWKVRDEWSIEHADWSVDLARPGLTALTVSPDSSMVAVAGSNGDVDILDGKKGREVVRLIGRLGPNGIVAFSPDSGLVATGGADGAVRLWNPWTGEQEHALKGHARGITALSFASDEVLMSASEDGTVRVWIYHP
ncbi:protein kinase : Protein kinase OS=Nostoc punctiforme (strain ATCC 29133 / PCC 73102) GN=Npun_R1546 PE=4 SV=1: WD40: WD40 [Gemmata massiliana]|uniref:Anaphase-promoting complex subunit 4 WD40 domain-containing protein n=1 Tax=Gemmata massiliana TaxID=1210884 RepID=A0A6P2CVA0_9BACT|nr:hypothetical protein [Gemmata massiliana]VTR92517.1 protein kinase : Protein kinase OS=Nostoc punctiforme (strain ATCC 29133 / PCC 73102) GN=Npun_R1546 PE=4 SV=1: WD40: WD40 [Gemmata massiliana]